MPLTFAHPAAVLPLLPVMRRLRLDPTCLAIGAMAPDLEYFIHGRMHGGNGHTFVGLFTWSLPATLITALLFHAVIKWPLLFALPGRWSKRMIPELAAPWPPRPSSPAFWALAVISTLLGAITHLVWDGFTHTEGFIALKVPTLLEPVHLPLLPKAIPLCRVLQHISTALGVAIVAIWFARRRWPAAVVIPPAPRTFVRAFAGVAIAISLVLSYAHLLLWFRHRTPEIDEWVVATITGLLAGGIITACAAWSRADAWHRALETATPPS